MEEDKKEESNFLKSNKEGKTIPDRIVPNKIIQSVVKALDRIERKIGIVKFREIFKTITTDNGSEFRNWKII